MRVQPDQDEEMLIRNVKLTESPYNLGFIYLHLGHLGVSRERYPEAEKHYLKSVENFEMFASQNPSSNSAQRDLSIALVYLADAVATARRRQAAEALYRRPLPN